MGPNGIGPFFVIFSVIGTTIMNRKFIKAVAIRTIVILGIMYTIGGIVVIGERTLNPHKPESWPCRYHCAKPGNRGMWRHSDDCHICVHRRETHSKHHFYNLHSCGYCQYPESLTDPYEWINRITIFNQNK